MITSPLFQISQQIVILSVN